MEAEMGAAEAEASTMTGSVMDEMVPGMSEQGGVCFARCALIRASMRHRLFARVKSLTE